MKEQQAKIEALVKKTAKVNKKSGKIFDSANYVMEKLKKEQESEASDHSREEKKWFWIRITHTYILGRRERDGWWLDDEMDDWPLEEVMVIDLRQG